VAQSTGVSTEPERLLLQRRLDRAHFLRLLGAGAGLSMFPASLLAGPAGAQDAVSGIQILSPDGEYPIGIWWPPPPEQTSTPRYAEIAAAHFNFVIGGNGVGNDTANPPALEAAEANGLRFILTDKKLRDVIESGGGVSVQRSQEAVMPSVMRNLFAQDEPQLASSVVAAATPSEAVTQRIQELQVSYGGSPALAGLNLYDEPHTSLFGILELGKDEVLRLFAGQKLPYINVWPSYASSSALGARDYVTYLERYFAEVNPPLLCYDHYPLLAGTKITGSYFYNWAVIRRLALQFGVPSWGFIQSVGFDGSGAGLARRRRPNEQEILWQVNVALAYGAKGIQYFTYWTPDSQPGDPIQFGQALISLDGQQTALYGYAQRVNTYLKAVGKVLLPLVSESVVHAQEKRLPKGARPFRRDAYVRAISGSTVILSQFSEDGTTKRYLFVANCSFANTARTRLTVGGAVTKVSRLNITTGEFDPVRLVGRPRRDLPIRIAPGAARLYLLQ